MYLQYNKDWIPMEKWNACSFVANDGVITTIMDIDRDIRCGNDTGASVYNDRGILFIWSMYNFPSNSDNIKGIFS